MYFLTIFTEGSGDFVAAEKLFREATTHDPIDFTYQIALGRVLLALDRPQACQALVAALEARGFLEPQAQSLKDQLELRLNVEDSGGTQAARKALEADPQNAELRIHLAEALSVDKRYTEACDLLLEVISTDRTELRHKAKEAMVTILGAMGPRSQQASDYRRRLATALY